MAWNLKHKSTCNKNLIYIIAEIGVNHNGDPALAHKCIDEAAKAGADAVKFQTFVTDELVSVSAPRAAHHIANVKNCLSHYELLTKLEIPFQVFASLKEHCEEQNIGFISTPYDIPSAEFLIGLNVETIKIASAELVNLPLLDVVRASKIPVMLSTGMSTWQEIVESVRFIKEFHNDICILKCTSNYPASPDSINLNGIKKIRQEYPDLLVGLSDHSEGPEVSLAAVGVGIDILERHFTLDKDAWGPDHKASMLPGELKALVKSIRKCEQALGSIDWGIQNEEMSQRETMQKGVWSRRKISKGERLTIKDVKFMRPSLGLSPRDFYLNYSGQAVNREIGPNQVILPEHFEG